MALMSLKTTLTNSRGLQVEFISYGGIITRLMTPDRQGKQGDIVLGLDTLEDYETKNPYFGAIIGRYGNRIEQGKFALEGKEYSLTINDGANHLHGGTAGLDKNHWQS